MKFRGGAVDSLLSNVPKGSRPEMLKQRRHKAAGPALLQKTVRGVGESHRRRFAVNALGQYLGFALCPDLFCGALLSSSCAFFNANSPDGAANDPVWAFGAFDELGMASTRKFSERQGRKKYTRVPASFRCRIAVQFGGFSLQK
jgi:hypothetical protein